MQRSLTKGPITGSILLFALPLMLGNLLQQMYNIADTWIVGRFLGADALAAVGSSYTLMTFLTSILLGLCMGSGAAISMQYGSGEQDRMRQSVFLSFVLIAGISLVLNVLVYLGLDGILWVLRVPEELRPLMKEYLLIIFLGIMAAFLYNYFANLLRAHWLGAGGYHRHWVLPEKEALKKQLAQKQKPGTFLSRLARSRFRVLCRIFAAKGQGTATY